MARKVQRGRIRAIREIETGLRQLSVGLRRLAYDVIPRTGNGRSFARKRPVTPALRLQGRYMGLIRTLPTMKKKKVMAIRANKGVHEAIRAARAMRG